jgi:glutamate-ammonia-ligase adenylyltransferase
LQNRFLRRRRIIDTFVGSLPPEVIYEVWLSEINTRMVEVFTLLESQSEQALTLAKQKVNEWVADRLSRLKLDSMSVLFPMRIDVDNREDRCTRLKVRSEDTPFFLYAFSTALSLREISIEHVKIQTSHNRIEDEFEFVDSKNGKKLDESTLDDVKLSLLLTKQFTYFLSNAPNPYNAIERFEKLIEDILDTPEQDRLVDLVSNPRIMEDLARLLGTSDYIWEDFIRLQYENLLPLLSPHLGDKSFCPAPETIDHRLNQALEKSAGYEDDRRILNEFKDNEIFLIDLDHILSPEYDFRKLSERLTILAERVVNTAFSRSFDRLARRFGRPKTVAGFDARYALLGLGKLGGQALGYASDIEFIFVYSDNGSTDREGRGSQSISNAEFFEYLVKEAVGMIEAKREGIFHIDLRLRPYGNDGPLACSLETFCDYYGPEGPAHSYEKLSLVRLRCFGGDANFGATLERLRDKMIYASSSIDLKALQLLRERQLAEKTQPGKLNAKFSPGALVDLEYAVQILQVLHGEDQAPLRTPSIHKALDGLVNAGVIKTQEASSLVGAYHFLRRLINGLRMLRGSAQDLFLPPQNSDEFRHLARRIGYVPSGDVAPETELHIDFETSTAAVRVFVENHFGPESLPDQTPRNVADIVLTEAAWTLDYESVLRKSGFGEPQRAFTNLKLLAGKGEVVPLFARLAILACDILARVADPDQALNNWERFVRGIESSNDDAPKEHYQLLLSQPKRLEILLELFSASQFLSNSLIHHPQFLDWVTEPRNLHAVRGLEEIKTELRSLSSSCLDRDEWLNGIRRFRKREILRIGLKDIILGKPTQEIFTELSNLAEGVTAIALERIWNEREEDLASGGTDHAGRFCILAFGKLGGRELNYSSDIDLLGIYRGEDGRDRLYSRVLEQLRADLASHTSEGYAYRVDFRLRPYGQSGVLTYSHRNLLSYYRRDAAIWEIQALLKMRPVAGNLQVGEAFLGEIREIFLREIPASDVIDSILDLRRKAIKASEESLIGGIDIKNGPGGLRDIEFLVQGLQLIHAPKYPHLINGNTLEALEALSSLKLVDRETAKLLEEDYLFLRRVEHHLQIWEDQQIHSLPRQAAELDALARRMLGYDSDSQRLLQLIDSCTTRIQKACNERLYNGASGS